MGLRINTNVVSLVAQHRLDATSKKQTTALERLSSGLRINRGADDVVGLLKSESLRSQLRGISVASTNIATAKNLLGVAEGTLAQLTSIAQSIREKVVQAADDSISAADRGNLTTSIADLSSEFSRLVSAAKFDGVSLLDGSFTNKGFQVGANAGDTLTVSLTDTRASVVGKVAIFTTLNSVQGIGMTRASSVGGLNLQNMTALVINGVTVSADALAHDGVSSAEGDESAIAIATAINAVSGQSGVRAEVLANVQTFTIKASGTSAASNFWTLNGITVLSGTLSGTLADDFVSAINGLTSQTGVTATYLNTTTSMISLTAADGRNIVWDIRSGTIAATSSITHSTFGALQSASVKAVYRGTVRLTSDEAVLFGGSVQSGVLGTSSTTVSLSTDFTLSQLEVSSGDEAEVGIYMLDNVIRQLQQRRSEVGSKVNRMETAEAELQIRQENLTESESRIRDADIASETANLTAAQILQQAGIQVLQRANALPQVALALLQG